MSGQLVIVLVPSANRVAAISFSTLFLAPPTATSPDNRFPPVTTNRSLTRVSLDSGAGSVRILGQAARYRLTMAVHLTRIYTRTGDDGTTGLSDFSRVSKNDARLAAYADCDETNAAIGVAVSLGHPDEHLLKVLRQIQNDLFDAGADLSTPVVEKPEHPPLRISQSYIDRLETWCDEFNEPLAGVEFVCAARRYAAVGSAACGQDRRAASRAVGVAGDRGSSRQRQRVAGQVPEPALRSAVHSRQSRQSGRRRLVETGWMTACANTIDLARLALMPFCAALATTAATPARIGTRSMHRGPAPPRSRACAPGWCHAVRG